MKKIFALAFLALALSGCVMPKPIEFGQDKVHRVPVAKPRETEVQRQAAQRASQKAQETLQAALEEDCSPTVVEPAKETATLSDSVSRSLGPPLKPARPTVTSDELARQLDTAVAKLDQRLEDFRKDNDENAGKKIEGTGVFSIGYISYLIIMFLVLVGAVILFRVLKVVANVAGAANPAVGVGLKAIQLGGAAASKAVGQLIKGGETFKQRLSKDMPELDEALRVKVEEIFRTSHMTAQDEDVQHVIKELTRK